MAHALLVSILHTTIVPTIMLCVIFHHHPSYINYEHTYTESHLRKGKQTWISMMVAEKENEMRVIQSKKHAHKMWEQKEKSPLAMYSAQTKTIQTITLFFKLSMHEVPNQVNQFIETVYKTCFVIIESMPHQHHHLKHCHVQLL